MAKKITHEEFVRRSCIIHNNKYEYPEKYIKAVVKIKINCKEHGLFKQLPWLHLQGSECPKCSYKDRNIKKTKTLLDFIIDANKIHNNKYDYSKSNYKGNKKKLIIICKLHGDFLQTPDSHLRNSGCPECGKLQCGVKPKSFENFVKDANIVHNNKYIYLSSYINNYTKIEIICKLHGIFYQIPNSHLNGSGCPTCGRYISKQENCWLDYLKIHKKFRQKTIIINNSFIKTDAYDPVTNTIYEFYGDYWHGNLSKYNSNDINVNTKKTFGQLNNETIKREILIKENGYNLITIWESEWKSIVKTLDATEYIL